MRENLSSAASEDLNDADDQKPAAPRICSRLLRESEASIGDPP
jgi:hypothetical protein